MAGSFEGVRPANGETLVYLAPEIIRGERFFLFRSCYSTA